MGIISLGLVVLVPFIAWLIIKILTDFPSRLWRIVKKYQLVNDIAVRNQIKDVLFTYIEHNKGKAFTAKALYNRCIEETLHEVSISEIIDILYELNINGKVQINNKENVYYYFVS